MSNKAMSEAVGQALISDLVSLCGRLYKEGANKKNTLYLHADEFNEIVQDEFVTLLNKAGGAGIRVTAYTQTINDLGAAFGSNKDKAKMLTGNFGTLIMMRIANQDTARILTECLEKVNARSVTPSSQANDRPDGKNGELFTTYNTDTIKEDEVQIVTENDLFSLPKGQAFILTNGGEIYKVRFPLPKRSEENPTSFNTLISEVNLKKELIENNDKEEFIPDKTIENQVAQGVKETNIQSVNEKATEEYTKIAEQFIAWLNENINGTRAKYKLNSDKYVFNDAIKFGKKNIFISEHLLNYYQSLSKIYSAEIIKALKLAKISDNKQYIAETPNENIKLLRLPEIFSDQEEITITTIKEVSYEK